MIDSTYVPQYYLTYGPYSTFGLHIGLDWHKFRCADHLFADCSANVTIPVSI